MYIKPHSNNVTEIFFCIFFEQFKGNKYAYGYDVSLGDKGTYSELILIQLKVILSSIFIFLLQTFYSKRKFSKARKQNAPISLPTRMSGLISS